MNISTRKLSLPAIKSGSGPATLDENGRSVRVVACTENPCAVHDWKYGVINEVLLMSGAAYPEQIPLLDSHDRSTSKAVLGSARNLTRSGACLEADVVFSSDADGEAAFTKLREGHLTDFSIGYVVTKSVFVPQGKTQTIEGRKFGGPLKVATQWTIRELSITPIGADAAAKARSTKGTNMQMEKRMKDALILGGLDESATDAQAWEYFRALPREGQKDALDSMGRADGISKREAMEIHEHCLFGAERFGLANRSGEFMARGMTLDEVRKETLRELMEKWKPIGTRIEPGLDQADKRRAAVVDGFALRAGAKIERPAPGANEYRTMSLLDLARECLSAQGVRTFGMCRHELAGRALFGHATSDFPKLMSGVAGKILLSEYRAIRSTYELWCSIGEAPDFKDMSRLRLSEGPDLLPVLEGGEYKEGSFTEAGETYRIVKWGRMFSVTREAIINDDLSALTRIPQAFGKAAKRKVNDVVYKIITDNAAMADGIPLFHASHGNLEATAKTAPSVASLTAARTAMRMQKGLNGAVIDIVPAFILAPVALETGIDTLLNSIGMDAANAAIRNPFFGKLQPIIDPRLDANSTTAWYLAANPSQSDTVEVSFLEGRQEPYVEEQQGFEIDGVRYKVRFEFGAKALDWRGLFKNPGA